MFEFVRTHNRILQFVLVLLVFPSFVFFGVQGYSRFNDESAAPVATVDGRNITRAEWDSAHQRAVERLRRQAPSADLASMDSPEARRETLESLMRERLLMVAASRSHLLPSDERLGRIFRSDPQYAGLRNADGTVNREFLAAQGLTSEGFAEQLRLELGMRQVSAGASASAFLPEAAVQSTLDALLQRRVVQWQRFDPREHFASIKPSEQDLQAFLKANEEKFRLPEQADIEYVVLDVDSLRASAQVSEDELRRYYAENEARYTRAQERRASHILIASPKEQGAGERQKARQRAEELLQQARKAPATFAELARKHSQDPGSAAKGGDLDFFGRGAMVKPFEDAVFAMKPGEISPVVESDFGFHVIQLTAVRGGEKQAFEAVRAEIETEVRRQLAQRRFAEAAEQFTNTVYEQADSLQPAIDKLKLERRTATVGRQPQPGASGVLASTRLLSAVFSDDAIKNRRNTQAIDLGNSRLVSARIVKHQPARVPGLAEVSQKVAAAFQAQKAAEIARQRGEARLAAVKADPSTALPQSATVSRMQAADLPRAALEAILRASADKLPTPLGVPLGEQGYLVVMVTKVLPAEKVPGLDDMMKSQLSQAWAAAEWTAHYDMLKRRYGAELVGPGRAALPAPVPASGS